jgi:hypothetical protein
LNRRIQELYLPSLCSLYSNTYPYGKQRDAKTGTLVPHHRRQVVVLTMVVLWVVVL